MTRWLSLLRYKIEGFYVYDIEIAVQNKHERDVLGNQHLRNNFTTSAGIPRVNRRNNNENYY